MGWLPSAPQLKTNPLHVVRNAAATGLDPKDYADKYAMKAAAYALFERCNAQYLE